jgi:hypothetical protein
VTDLLRQQGTRAQENAVKLLYQITDADNATIESDLSVPATVGARWWADYMRGGPRIEKLGAWEDREATEVAIRRVMLRIQDEPANPTEIDRFEKTLAEACERQLESFLGWKEPMTHIQLSTDYGPEGLLRDAATHHRVGGFPGKSLMAIGLFSVTISAGYHQSDQFLWFPIDGEGNRLYPTIERSVVLDKELDQVTIKVTRKETWKRSLEALHADITEKLPEIERRKAEIKEKFRSNRKEVTEEEQTFYERNSGNPLFWTNYQIKQLEVQPDHARSLQRGLATAR